MLKRAEFECQNCGKVGLEDCGGGLWLCPSCQTKFKEDSATNYNNTLDTLLDKLKQENVANARRNLWTAVNQKYLSTAEIEKWSAAILQYLPDDFYARFYKAVLSSDPQPLNDFLNAIDEKARYSEIEWLIGFVCKSLNPKNLLGLNRLIERTYKNCDLNAYEKCATMLSEKAKAIDSGVYEPTLPRDVFVAYSSVDMDFVEQVVRSLENEGLACFVALRNLPHGRGAIENYQDALYKAMDSCKTMLFISSSSSRRFDCDALRIELPYIKNIDLSRAPQYRDDYEKMPSKFKKFRIELLKENYEKESSGADRLVKSFFSGCEFCYSVPEAIDRIAKRIYDHQIDDGGAEDKLKAAQAENERLRQTQQAAYEKQDLQRQAELQSRDRQAQSEKEKQALIIQAEREKRELRAAAEKEKEELRLQLEELKRQKSQTIMETAKSTVATKLTQTATKVKTAVSGAFGKAAAAIETAVTAPKPAPIKIDPFDNSATQAKSAIDPFDTPTLEFKLSTDGGSYSVIKCKRVNAKGFSIVIPEVYNGKPVTEIGSNAFGTSGVVNPTKEMNSMYYRCSGLTSITIPNGIRSIGEKAFCNCGALASITIPTGVTSIGDTAFFGCRGLTSITIPTGVTSIGYAVFSCCSGLTSITIPASVTSIGKHAFSGCDKLTSITIPTGVTSIRNSVFGNCVGLTSITIPTGVKSIEDGAFNGCSGLTSITIPTEVTSIGNSAFGGCNGLTSITIPIGVTSIRYAAFYDCRNLKTILVSGGKASMKTWDRKWKKGCRAKVIFK